MTKLKINTNWNQKTLIDFMLNKFPNISISKIKKNIKNGNIKVNNNKTFYLQILKVDDEIKIYNNDFKSTKIDWTFLNAKKLKYILYEDENILIIDKPRGLLCQEDAKEKIDTLNNRIKKYLYEFKKWDPENQTIFTPNICHRIDKYTTGIVVAAKNSKTLAEINKLWNTNVITKQYICLVYGIPKHKSKTLENWIKITENNSVEIIQNNQFNKKIVTKYEIIEEYNNYSKLLVTIETGKKHQIRIHLSYINHPILGDSKYNKINNMNFKYPCLNSYKIKFNFPKGHFLENLNNLEIKSKNFSFK